MSGWKRGDRNRDTFGIQKQGPITENAPTYPPNSFVTPCSLHLSRNDQCLVAMNRILVYFWKNLSPFYYNASPDWSVQHTQLLSYVDDAQLPKELLDSKYNLLHYKTNKVVSLGPKHKKQLITKDDGASDDEEVEHKNVEEFEVEELNDFGGDDYAVDYFAEDDYEEDFGNDNDPETL